MKVNTKHTVNKEMIINTIRDMIHMERKITKKSIIQEMKGMLEEQGMNYYHYWDERSGAVGSNAIEVYGCTEEASEVIFNKYWKAK
ncbi:MAG: hypothetical protein KAV87_27095 [Desulfobacteraceae bacterium]|nr:hypothetical protein [Desulfobacteraceae bacterium]